MCQNGDCQHYSDDDNFDTDLDDDEIWEREQEDSARCTCGAFVWSDKRHEFVHVDDCCCGAM